MSISVSLPVLVHAPRGRDGELIQRALEGYGVPTIICATANPVEVIVAQSEQGRGVLGVIDGSSPKGVEAESDLAWRHDLLRKIGYKR